MNNTTKLTIAAAFIVAAVIVGAANGSIPSAIYAQTSGNSTGNSTSTGSTGNSTSGGSANSTGTTGSNSTSG